jgi:hypothetical protein
MDLTEPSTQGNLRPHTGLISLLESFILIELDSNSKTKYLYNGLLVCLVERKSLLYFATTISLITY